MRDLLRDQRGRLTRLELLAVLAALSILVVVLLPGMDSVAKEAKVHAAVQDIQMAGLALLRFHADMGVWPPDNDPDPGDGLPDVDLMGGNCGAAGSTQAASTNDPGIRCPGTGGASGAQVALSPTAGSPDFRLVPYTAAMSKRWRGPYINRELKRNPFGGSYVLKLDKNIANNPGQTVGGMSSTANDVVIELTRVPVEFQRRIDRELDDGNLSTGFVQGTGTTLQVVVAMF